MIDAKLSRRCWRALAAVVGACVLCSATGEASAGPTFVRKVTFSSGEGTIENGIIYNTEYLSFDNFPPYPNVGIPYPVDISSGYLSTQPGFLQITGPLDFTILGFDIDTDLPIEYRSSELFLPLFTIIPDGIAGFQHVVVPTPHLELGGNSGGGGAIFFNAITGGPAFKIDNVVFSVPVPEPGAWALMVGGLAMAGTALRRRRIAFC